MGNPFRTYGNLTINVDDISGVIFQPYVQGHQVEHLRVVFRNTNTEYYQGPDAQEIYKQINQELAGTTAAEG